MLGNLNISKVQEDILAYWDEHKTFERSLEISRKGREVVFYDGPPFPTGEPHYGTVLVSFIKDMLARYLTMRGNYVPRVWGWDCHGLPIETQVEKDLGIEEKVDIESSIGVKAFNEACYKRVSSANDTWRDYIREMARWVDYDNNYKTMDRDYMESVLWTFKTCYDKDYIYQDYRVVPYCHRCETSLSISDTRESDSTRPRQDPSVVVRFKTDEVLNDKPVYFLAWTTTPWTLPSNLALAAHPSLDYAFVDSGDYISVLCKDTISTHAKQLFDGEPNVLETRPGSELIGKTYTPLFPYFAERANEGAFRVIAADFVTTEEGVGVVHVAPAFGEDDYWVCRGEKITLVCPVDDQGRFTQEVSDFAGRNVLECNSDVIRMLKTNGLLVDQSTLEHNYPHCWRCREPLIYRAMSAWYFSVEKVKEQLLEQNEDINWVPETVKYGRFGNWLQNARDWNISRNRYWSTPIPVWICTDCDSRKVLGSIDEIENVGNCKLEDLHRQHLDAVEFSCECGGTFKRIPEVMDCWFESGAMPYAQKHYPFENEEWLKDHFPADFIVEYTGQIRCWFYYLHVLAVALFGKPAIRNTVVHGTILAGDGKKLSKSSKNYTDPKQLMRKYGTDSLRLYLFQTPAVLMGDLRFDDDGAKQAFQQIVLPLWNACSFLETYAQIDGYELSGPEPPEAPDSTLDRWILARLCAVRNQVTVVLDSYQIDQYTAPLIELVDELTNWYIRRSRRRFWVSGMTDDKKSAYETLNYVLTSLCKLLAPVAPVVTEHLYRHLTGDESVHLTEWPEVPATYLDDELLEKGRLIRRIVYLGRSIRKKYSIKGRQPLALLQVVLPEDGAALIMDEDRETIIDELNVKEFSLLSDASEIADVKHTPDFRRLGQRLGKDMPLVTKAIKTGQFEPKGDGFEIELDDRTIDLGPEDLVVSYEAKSDLPVAGEQGVVVGLDTRITDELRAEGAARELVRHIQDMRKAAGYDVTARINVQVEPGIPSEWNEYVLKETLGSECDVADPDQERDVSTDLGDFAIRVALERQS